MKSLTHLILELTRECGSICGVSTTRDCKTIAERAEHEGVSFLTITLPSYAKDFERSLALGRIDDGLFLSFKKDKSGLPLLLGGFLRLVFNPCNDRHIHDEPSVDAIFFIRQITLAFGKIFALPSNQRQYEAMRQYIMTDQEVSIFNARSIQALHGSRQRSLGIHQGSSRPHSVLHERGHDSGGLDDRLGTGRYGESVLPVHRFCEQGKPDSSYPVSAASLREVQVELRKVLLHLYRGPLLALDRLSFEDGLVGVAEPRHGPGATADGLAGNQKLLPTTYPVRLEREFPFTEWNVHSHRYSLAVQDRVHFLGLASEIPVKVISVPKTMKTSRIIAEEPTAMQYAQQALMRALVPRLEGDPLISPMIGFTDQAPNRELAREGSLTGELATLDLSEASDRVSTQHVRLLFDHFPSLGRMVFACRSRKAAVPGFGTRTLAKFASMGSALTFPLEAMIFLGIVVLAASWERHVPVTHAFVRSLHGSVRVYGDDIIVPVDVAARTVELLEVLGLKVNHSKSFWTGNFRESCGGDYFSGQDVTPARLRQFLPDSTADAVELNSLVSFRNQLYQLGFWQTCRVLDNSIEAILWNYFPVVEETSTIIGRHSVCFSPMAERIDKDLHTPLVKGWALDSTIPVNSLDGVAAMMKWYLHVGDREHDPLAEDHLTRSGRPKSSRLKLGWRRPY